MEINYRDKFNELSTSYNRLAINLKDVLVDILKKSQIEFLSVDSRIKEYDSFIEKTKRKNYTDPFSETEDICGLRIICYYKADIDSISEIIQKEFVILNTEDKIDILFPEQFGYRSLHFIIKIPPKYKDDPRFNGLDDLKIELQIRTIMMHAWAEIQHKFAYKKDYQIKNDIKREFSLLSALLELADKQYEDLRGHILEYRKSIINQEESHKDPFDSIKTINLDNLQAFLDFHFHDLSRHEPSTADLLDELIAAKISFSDLNKIFHVATNFVFSTMAVEENTKMAQTGIIRWSLMLINESYWDYFKEKIMTLPYFIKKFENYRERFKINNA